MSPEQLCRAFCDGVKVSSVPCGFAVETPFTMEDGDPLLFYVVRAGGDTARLEDDGQQVPMLEANGVDLSRGARSEAFEELLREYQLTFDGETQTIRSAEMPVAALPAASLRFVAAMLRLQDFLLLHPRTVRNTFREDAINAIHEAFDSVATVSVGAPISEKLPGYTADVVLSNGGVPPLAVYLGTSDEKGLQALVLKMETEKYQQVACRVVLLLERAKDPPLREPTYALAQARLDDVLTFRGVERDSMARMHSLFSSVQSGTGLLQ